jgi:hypothetical protein
MLSGTSKITACCIWLGLFSASASVAAFDDRGTDGTLIRTLILPHDLDENSGLIIYDGLFWTINDSGGEPWLYALDTTSGRIIRTVGLRGAENTDWEEITQDESFLYIGDFGNNRGDRRDLRIYTVSKNLLSDSLVSPGIITFRYSNQTDYTPVPYNTAFDCEAMIGYRDTLYLFTKNWTGGDTYIYKLPAEKGDHVAFLCGRIEVKGLVTAATYDAKTHRLYLLGYNDFIPFTCLLDHYLPGDEIKGDIKQCFYPDFLGLQTEGLTLTGQDQIIVSCEKGYDQPAIYRTVPCCQK